MTKQANKIKKRINGIEKQGQAIAPNKIAQLIAQRYPGIEFKPTAQLVDSMGLSMITFNRILANEAEPTFSQALRISRWLGVQVDELYQTTNP